MKLSCLVIVLLAMTGCASNIPKQKQQTVESPGVVTIHKEFTPQVWSDHKKLNISELACSKKGTQILHSLGFIQIVKSRYGEYVYGNYINNRAVIKCISINDQTLVYAIVAGPNKRVVEKLRNEIMWQY